ncbi:MAG: isoprenylcysteine carboxylmethyltransferase family protein, partial [Mesorhizobium sp.]
MDTEYKHGLGNYQQMRRLVLAVLVVVLFLALLFGQST